MTRDELRWLSEQTAAWKAIDEIRRQHDLMTSVVPSSVSSNLLALPQGYFETLEDITKHFSLARQRWIEIAALSRPRELEILEHTRLDTDAWMTNFESIRKNIDAQLSAYKAIGAGLERFDWQHVLPVFQIYRPEFLGLHETTDRLRGSFASLALEIDQTEPTLIQPAVFDVPPLRMAGQQAFLDSLVGRSSASSEVEDDSEAEPLLELLSAELRHRIDEELPGQLASIHAELPRLWNGSKSSLQSNNPDRVRHFSISLREMLTHVLHRLAPDEEIERWSRDPKLKDKGKFTRAARLSYISRDVKPGGFADLTKESHKAALAAMALLHKGAHGLEESFDDAAAENLRLVVGSHLLLLLGARRP